jgi:hypothetical protein
MLEDDVLIIESFEDVSQKKKESLEDVMLQLSFDTDIMK